MMRGARIGLALFLMSTVGGCLSPPPQSTLAGELVISADAIFDANPHQDTLTMLCRTGAEVVRGEVFVGAADTPHRWEIALQIGYRYSCYFVAEADGMEIFLGFLRPAVDSCSQASGEYFIDYDGENHWAGVVELGGVDACASRDLPGLQRQEQPPQGVFCGNLLVRYALEPSTGPSVGASFITCVSFGEISDGGLDTEAGFYYGFTPGASGSEAVGCPLGDLGLTPLPFESGRDVIAVGTSNPDAPVAAFGGYALAMSTEIGDDGLVERLQGMAMLYVPDPAAPVGVVSETSGGLYRVDGIASVPPRLTLETCLDE